MTTDLRDKIFSASGEPIPGNTLYYSQVYGTLQAVKLSENCWSMPVTHGDDPKITGYVYRNRTPEFMYECQWIAVPFTGGTVHRRIDVSDLVNAIPKYVAKVTILDSDYDYAYRISAMFAKSFRFARVTHPALVSGTNNHLVRLMFPLNPIDVEKFIQEFNNTFGGQMNLRLTITLEPKTPKNWEF